MPSSSLEANHSSGYVSTSPYLSLRMSIRAMSSVLDPSVSPSPTMARYEGGSARLASSSHLLPALQMMWSIHSFAIDVSGHGSESPLGR